LGYASKWGVGMLWVSSCDPPKGGQDTGIVRLSLVNQTVGSLFRKRGQSKQI